MYKRGLHVLGFAGVPSRSDIGGRALADIQFSVFMKQRSFALQCILYSIVKFLSAVPCAVPRLSVFPRSVESKDFTAAMKVLHYHKAVKDIDKYCERYGMVCSIRSEASGKLWGNCNIRHARFGLQKIEFRCSGAGIKRL